MAKKILCIDDDPCTMDLLVEDLSDHGYEVVCAFDGHQGMEVLLSTQPDLVLCDINLPLISGFEILMRLTALSTTFADVPFIFLTAMTDRESELYGRQLGADDYVTKPIDFEILAKIIEKRLERVQTAEPSRVARLSQREIDTLTWAARGKTSDEIAQILGLTKTAVDAHLNSARTKLAANTRTQAVVKAMTSKLIKP